MSLPPQWQPIPQLRPVVPARSPRESEWITRYLEFHPVPESPVAETWEAGMFIEDWAAAATP